LRVIYKNCTSPSNTNLDKTDDNICRLCLDYWSICDLKVSIVKFYLMMSAAIYIKRKKPQNFLWESCIEKKWQNMKIVKKKDWIMYHRNTVTFIYKKFRRGIIFIICQWLKTRRDSHLNVSVVQPSNSFILFIFTNIKSLFKTAGRIKSWVVYAQIVCR
jgi:hypothetical protein